MYSYFQGPCNEGHGIEFHSRISPSPNRSYHRKRRRRSLQISGDTNKSNSSLKQIDELSEIGNVPSDKTKMMQEDESTAHTSEMAHQPLVTTSTPLPESSDVTFDSSNINISTTTTETSKSGLKSKRNLMTEFLVQNDSPSTSQQQSPSPSSPLLNLNDQDQEYDQFVTRMLREKTKIESSHIIESNVSVRSLTRKRFLEKKQATDTPLSISSQRG